MGVSVFVVGRYIVITNTDTKHSTTAPQYITVSTLLLVTPSLSVSLSICLLPFILSSSHLALPIECTASVCLYMVVQFGYGRPEKAAEDTKDDVGEQLNHRPVLYNMRRAGGERRLDTTL